MNISDEQVCLMALTMLRGIGAVTARQLMSYCGSATEIFKKPKGKLMKIPDIGEKTAHTILTEVDFTAAELELKKASQLGVEVIFFNSPAYPHRLKRIPDAPFVLYKQGSAAFDVAKAIAIVGTRRATDYGKRIVEELIAVLATYDDILIVSGLAYGIDIHVHKCCLQYRIPTVGVMGSGIDVVYPPTHRTVAQEMIKQGGGLLTEYKIGTSPDAPHFPERNRIIAGLVDVVVVVEAAQSGGALITAEYANNYHREVAAFPGSVFHEFSEGCHQLIRLHKAHLITKANDLIELMNWNKKQTFSSPQPTRMPQHFSQDEQKIWLLLAEQPLHIDELSIRSHIPIHTLASILLAMELNGWIQALPGKRFKLASL